MDPTQGEQNNQSQEKQQGGGISQGINAINNTLGNFNPIRPKASPGGMGSKILNGAKSMASKVASASSMGPWTIVIVIVFIVVFTFIIVFSGVSGGALGTPTSEPTSTISPTETPTLTPGP